MGFGSFLRHCLQSYVWTTDQQWVGLHFPAAPCAQAPPLAYLRCVLTPRGSSAALVARTAAVKFVHRNGKVSVRRISSTFHTRGPHSNHVLDLRIDPWFSTTALGFFSNSTFKEGTLSLFGFLRRATERKNALLHAATQVCGLCRGSVDLLGAPVRFGSNREDLPLALRVFRGAAGLQSAEEGAHSREDPGMDDPTVSPAWFSLWLLF